MKGAEELVLVKEEKYLQPNSNFKKLFIDQSKAKICTKKYEYFGVTTLSKADMEQGVGWCPISFSF